ncbi:MAG TPA: hypothetical protein VM513_36860 [Kofleriaceae bacterium]|jgi:hypothetical protein|nr:hypothetical protein [Kofleriaceae bacterium]
MRLAALVLLVGLGACGGNGPDDGAPPGPDGGNGVATSFNWTIRNGGTVLNCANANATDVYILVRPEQGLDETYRYACVLNPVNISLPAGRYAIEAQLIDSASVIVSAPAKAVTVPAPAQVMFDFYIQ